MVLPSLNLTQADVQTALRGFLLTVLAPGIEIVAAQDNRVPEPLGPDFIVMTPILRQRLETNIDLYADCAFHAAISDDVLVVSDVIFGIIYTGNTLFGVGVPSGTIILNQTAGLAGQSGNYQLSASGTIGNSMMASGTFLALQATEVTVQLDIHGPNSANNSQIISTLFRDNYAVEQFKSVGTPPAGWPAGIPYNGVAPLYADDPKQIPFLNAEQQYETRWVVDACMQANQVVTAPQQFASVLKISTIDVSVSYPG